MCQQFLIDAGHAVAQTVVAGSVVVATITFNVTGGAGSTRGVTGETADAALARQMGWWVLNNGGVVVWICNLRERVVVVEEVEVGASKLYSRDRIG